MKPVIIRVAKKQDKYFIAKAMIEASGGLCEYLLTDPLYTIKPEIIMAFEIAKDTAILSYRHCLIAEIENRPIGIICAYMTDDFFDFLQTPKPSEKTHIMQPFYQALPKNALYIDTLYIIPDCRGQGIGKYLLTSITAFFLKKHCPLICLYAWEDNGPAIKLYQQYGFDTLKAIRIDNLAYPFKEARLLMVVHTDLFNKKRSLSCVLKK